MNKKYVVNLSPEEQGELKSLIQAREIKASAILNAQILLSCDKNGADSPDESVAKTYHVSAVTVQRVREKFVLHGLQTALRGLPKGPKNKAVKIDGEVEAHLVQLACSEAPAGHNRWALRLLAETEPRGKHLARGRPSGAKKNELKPWQKVMWVIPPEQHADFVCQMERVLEVYKRPYSPDFPVACLDESPKQLVSEVKVPVKLPNGSTRFDYEYERQGAAEVCMRFEPLGGFRQIEVVETHDRFQWARVVANLVEGHFATATRMTLVRDNLSAHKPSALYELFEPQRAKAILDKLEFVFTPKHGSWLNMAEIELSALKRQGLGNRIPSKEKLIQQVAAFQNQRNNHFKKVNWQFSVEDARIKLKRLYPIIEQSTCPFLLDRLLSE